MRIIFLLFTVLVTPRASAQSPAPLIKYYDQGGAVGFKDLEGIVRFPAQYGGSPIADSFYNIIAVAEKTGNYDSYYLLRDGRQVGKDSIYYDGMDTECEQEGMIRYTGRKRLVGFFNAAGQSVIPAIYNTATPFFNGIAVVTRYARAACYDEFGDTLDCERPGWTGGEVLLINKKNEVLADQVTANLDDINWYSMTMNTPVSDTALYVTIKGKNGNVYSFQRYDREFLNWYETVFRSAATAGGKPLEALLFDEVKCWSEEKSWHSSPKASFGSEPAGKNLVLHARTKFQRAEIFRQPFSPLDKEKKKYRAFFSACNVHMKEKFPVFLLIVQHYEKGAGGAGNLRPLKNKKGFDVSQHLEFLRTAEGYRLISASDNF